MRRYSLVLSILFVSTAAAEEPKKAGPDWWSLQPVTRPALPKVKNSIWARNPIDVFILAKLEAAGLAPAPEAAPETLLRRLYFDLIGLPPSPEEMEAFLREYVASLQAAVEKVVDRLLASPLYGERWGRHWLDVVRFAESQGFERDKIRDHAWRYRDYVIDSFNRDKPYDQFVREQLAGDVLPNATAESIIATGFLVAGPYDEAGTGSASPIVRGRVREEEMEDMLAAVGQTFLGLTVNCARCHDHKFDPIPQRDYYRIKAVFDGVHHGDRSLPKDKVVAYAANIHQPEPTRILLRGDIEKPGDIVTPGGLSILQNSDFGLAADCPEAQRRLKFAEWAAAPQNPLTARVMVNRLRHYHFGRGLVGTPNDFGFNGERPSHPELLDWLASELANPQAAWSLKRIHRLIVTSATYRQSPSNSKSEIRNPKSDEENRLLWHFAPKRLEAEAIRDAMLSVSGQLRHAGGGPGFRPFKVTVFNSSFYDLIDEDRPEFNRRTVYRTIVNSAKDPLLEAFDCPEPSVKAPKRSVTTTPLQALGLMNNAFVQRQAKYFAARVQREAGDHVEAQIERAYKIALARTPSADERTRLVELARDHGLAQACWVLLNSSEFLYVK